MNLLDLHQEMIKNFLELPGSQAILNEPVRIVPDLEPEVTLMPAGDVPSPASRPEWRVTATCCGSQGEAYTECPEGFEGTLEEALHLPVNEKGIDARTMAAINAAMAHLGLCPGSFPDDPAVHARYAQELCHYVCGQFGNSHIVLIGYDGYLVKQFVESGLDFWTLDRNPDNITKDRFHHVIVNSARYNRESCYAWGRVFLVTGSTFCNGTVTQFLDHGIPVVFYGITCAGAASLLELPWFVPQIN